MMPNITKENRERILFQCECHGNHFLEVSSYNDEKNLWLSFIDCPNSLWETIKWWWKQRKTWTSEIELNLEDCKKLNEIINNFIKKV